MSPEAQSVNRPKTDELYDRYKALMLTYFPHWKVSPWEKKEQDAKVTAFLSDLEAYLLENHWSVETRSEKMRLYRYEKDPKLSLRIRNYMDYFGVHTVYLIEIKLIREEVLPWAKVEAEGEVVFDRLRRMA